MYYGEHVHTLKYRALYAATGSETVATIGEIGAGLASGATSERLLYGLRITLLKHLPIL
jgi:hypothetical protein